MPPDLSVNEAMDLLHAALRFGAGPDVVGPLAAIVLHHEGEDTYEDLERKALALRDRWLVPAAKDRNADYCDQSVLKVCIVCLVDSIGSPCELCCTDSLWQSVWQAADGTPLPGYLTQKQYRDRHAQRAKRVLDRYRQYGISQPPRTGKRGRPKKGAKLPSWWHG